MEVLYFERGRAIASNLEVALCIACDTVIISESCNPSYITESTPHSPHAKQSEFLAALFRDSSAFFFRHGQLRTGVD